MAEFLTYQRWDAVGFQKVSDSSETLINPVHIQRFDDAMRLIDEIQAARASTSGPLLPTDTFAQDSWVRWTRNNYERFSDIANRRVYFDIPANGEGVRDVNYNQTDYRYDILHRRTRERSPGGTITRYLLHPRGWLLQRWRHRRSFESGYHPSRQ